MLVAREFPMLEPIKDTSPQGQENNSLIQLVAFTSLYRSLNSCLCEINYECLYIKESHGPYSRSQVTPLLISPNINAQHEGKFLQNIIIQIKFPSQSLNPSTAVHVAFF